MKSKRTRGVVLAPTVFALVACALIGALGFAASNVEFSGPVAAVASSSLPVGTILPVRIDKTLSLEEGRAGQVIEAEVMQDVPLPNRERIRMRSRVRGTILSVGRAGEGSGMQLSMQFNEIEYDKQTIPILTSLRAMASFQAVRAAQMSFTGADAGTPAGWATTVQIGGDTRFGDGGEVRNHQKQKVGKGVIGGVLVYIRANPGAGCEGPEKGDDRLQALWVFSSDACGTYDFRGVQIVHQGRTKPKGAITLQFEKPDMKLEGATAMLLRVVAP